MNTMQITVASHTLPAGQYACTMKGPQLFVIGQEWVGLYALNYSAMSPFCLVTVPESGSDIVYISGIKSWDIPSDV